MEELVIQRTATSLVLNALTDCVEVEVETSWGCQVTYLDAAQAQEVVNWLNQFIQQKR